MSLHDDPFAWEREEARDAARHADLPPEPERPSAGELAQDAREWERFKQTHPYWNRGAYWEAEREWDSPDRDERDFPF